MSTRLHYSIDGTKAYIFNGGNTSRSQLAPATLATLEKYPYNTVNQLDQTNISFCFPVSVSITGMLYRRSADEGDTMSVSVSSDSSDGYDGTWTSVLGPTYLGPATPTMYTLTGTPCKWLQIGGGRRRPTSIYFFGSYLEGERFQFWKYTGDGQLTGDYPLSLPDAPSIADYHSETKFKLKNTHTSPHTYTLSIETMSSATDSLISNGWTLSCNGTPASSITVGPIAAGEYSNDIYVHADFLRSANPADGWHYWYVNATELT